MERQRAKWLHIVAVLNGMTKLWRNEERAAVIVSQVRCAARHQRTQRQVVCARCVLVQYKNEIVKEEHCTRYRSLFEACVVHGRWLLKHSAAISGSVRCGALLWH